MASSRGGGRKRCTLAAVREEAVKLVDDGADRGAGDVEVSVEQVVGRFPHDGVARAALGAPHCSSGNGSLSAVCNGVQWRAMTGVRVSQSYRRIR